MAYFCSGFFTLTDTSYENLKIDIFFEHWHSLQTKFNDVKISSMRHKEEDTTVHSLFAILDQKGTFEDELQQILFLGIGAGVTPWGVFYCHDSDENKNWMYTITLSPGLARTFYSGDPFFSPLSDKLGAHPFFSPLPNKLESNPFTR
ncbi:MAG: hypothetical protein AB7I41_20595 [Candidatus Sericytochromatia bacterium]